MLAQADSAESDGFPNLLAEPLFWEVIAALLVLFVLWVLFRALRGVADRMSRRRALREFVGGVDSFYKGEHETARDLLSKVIERDPENSEARILLGDACRELGDTAEGHKHHYQVAKVFGQELPRNRLSLGRDLLVMGRASEAMEHLEAAHTADPEDAGTVRLLLDASLGAGDMARAVTLAKRLESLSDYGDRERARRVRASVCARAGSDFVRQGRTKEGAGLLRTAVQLNPALVAPRVELVRSSWLSGTADSAEKELEQQLKDMERLADGGTVVFEPPAGAAAATPSGESTTSDGEEAAPALPGPEGPRALPAPGGSEHVPAVRGGTPPVRRETAEIRSNDIPDAPLAVPAGNLARKLIPCGAAYVCAHCGRGETSFCEECPDCGRVGTFAATDLAGLVPVEDMKNVFDEIQENRAFMRTLIGRAAAGDESAADRLVLAGPRVVKGVFREMLRVPENDTLVRVLARMGTEAVDAILEGWRRASAFSTRKLMREGVRAFRGLEDVLVRVFAGMGDEVLPVLLPLLESAERDLRLVVIDVLIRRGAAAELEDLRFVVPPKEILERLSACPEEDLGAFLDAVPGEGFLASRILVDRTFDAERALVKALSRGGNREKLRRVLMERGFSARAYDALEEVWEDRDTRVVVRDVVRSYGPAAADHLLKTYTSSSLPEEVREEALGLYMDLGGSQVERLVERLSEGDTETERALMRVIVAFGNRAVPVLVNTYGKTGLLGKVGLNKRRLTYRKITLLRALGQIGSYDALQGLRSLLTKEPDPELKRRIQGLLERKEPE